MAQSGKVDLSKHQAQGILSACCACLPFVDLILANATSPLQTAASATSDIPILGTSVTDYATALGIDNWTGTVGGNIWIATLCAILAGMLAGLVTGLLHTRCGIPAILAGILTQLALYSVNLRIMGRGAIVIGLAAVIIGQVLLGKIFHNFALKLLSAVIGAIIYYVVIQVVLRLGLDPNDLKLLTALVVAVFLSIPYWKSRYFTKAARKGGTAHA